MKIELLIQWCVVGAERAAKVERFTSGAGEEADIYRQIAAQLGRLLLRPMQDAPRDGSDILLVTNVGVVTAHYVKGQGNVTTQEGTEYWGPAWVCYDDAFTVEIEETPDGELASGVLGWLPIPESVIEAQRS